MEILDCDMQMVRDFLDEKEAPEYVKRHFENLLSAYEKKADAVEELEYEVDALDNERDAMRAMLEKVKYWLLDSLVHHKPVKDPHQVLRLVEEALLV